MSKFSDKCKELLRENGTNVYRLSHSSSLERTALQRMVTGKRLPNLEFVRQFCRELRMTAAEEEQVMELYKMESVGEELYQRRQYIQNLFRHLSALEEKGYADIASEFLPKPSENFCGCPAALKVVMAVSAVMEPCFASGKPADIYTNFPPLETDFFRQFLLLHHKYKNHQVSVSHLINFQIHAGLSFHNLQALNQILPLALGDFLDYTAYYYYSRAGKSDFSQLLFPYYVISENQVLEISGDLQSFILHTNERTVQKYIEEFKRIWDLSRPLIQIINDSPKAAWAEYQNGSPQKTEGIQVLEAQPCYRDLISDENFLAVIEEQVPDLRTAAEDILKGSKTVHERKRDIYFTEAGLDYFCESGRITGQVAALLPPLNVEQRIQALEQFLNRSDVHRYRCIVSPRLPLPLYLNFEIYGNQQFQLIKIENSLKVTLFTITESSICEAFADFAGALAESDIVLGEKETDGLVRKKLERLRASRYC